jgi:hypothetical protein
MSPTSIERTLAPCYHRGYNKSHSGPKLSSSLRLMIKSLPCLFQAPLDFLKWCCMSSTLNQVYSLVRAYHRAISWWLRKHLPFCLNGARVSLISSKYPTWCRSTFEPCCFELTNDFVYPSYSICLRECLLHSCQSSFGLKVTHPWKPSASAWNLIMFFSSQSIQ